MQLSDALEVAIGLTFVFLLVSLTMTAVVEYVESLTRARGRKLLDGIVELLGDPALPGSGAQAAEAIYRHPLVQGLFRGSFAGAAAEKRLPSYIPTRHFALALVDAVLGARVNAAQSDASIPAQAPLGDRLRLAAERVENTHLRRALIQAVEIGGDDIERVCRQLGDWYDGAMDRVAGKYKRRTHNLLFWLGLGAALLVNVNTLTIADSLSKDATLRRAVVAQAEARSAAGDAAGAGEAVEHIQRLGLPIGWSSGALAAIAQPLKSAQGTVEWYSGILGVVELVVGYLLTALAITLGAPFWFDLLNKLMVIRATVKPREKSPEEGSEDRRPAGQRIEVVAEAAAPAAAPPPPLATRPIDRDVYAAPPGPDEKPFEEWDR